MEYKVVKKKKNISTYTPKLKLSQGQQQALLKSIEEDGKKISEYVTRRQNNEYINPSEINSKDNGYVQTLNNYKAKLDTLRNYYGVDTTEARKMADTLSDDMSNADKYYSSFADGSDYTLWNVYGGFNYDQLKMTLEGRQGKKRAELGEKMQTKGVVPALRDYLENDAEKDKKINTWLQNRMKSEDVVMGMSFEDIQANAQAHKDATTAKKASESPLEDPFATEDTKEKEKNADEYIKNDPGSIAYYDSDGFAVSWEKALENKIAWDADGMSLEDINKQKSKALKEWEKSGTTHNKAILNAWENASIVKEAEGFKNNSNWEKNSQYVDVRNTPKFDELHHYINSDKDTQERLESAQKQDDYDAGLPSNVAIYSQMSQDEKSLYNYIFNTYGEKIANKYLSALETTLNFRNYKAEVTRKSQLNGWELAGENVRSVFQNLIGAIPEAAITVYKGATNTPIDPYSTDYALSNSASITRAETSKRIQENVGGFGGDVLNFLYNTGMSTLDSATAMTTEFIVPGSSLVIMGSRSGVDATKEAIKRGVSQGDAITTGIASGIFEAAFEKIPLDRIKGVLKNGKKATSNLFMTLMKEGGINASQEFMTSLSNEMADRIINEGLSNYEIAVDKYKLEGLSESEARNKASKDFVVQLAQDTGSGLLQGVGMTGGANVINYAVSKNVGEQIASHNNVQALTRNAKNLKGSEELTSLISEVEGFGTSDLSGKQYAKIGKLYNLALTEAATQFSDNSQARETVQAAVTNRLAALNVDNITDTAAAVTKTIVGENLTEHESKLMESAAAQRVVSEFNNFADSDYTSEWAATTMADITNTKNAKETAVREIQNLLQAETTIAETGKDKVKAQGIAVNKENTDVYKEGENVIASAVKSVETTKNGDILVTFENGTQKPLAETELSETSAEVIAYAKDYGQYADIFVQTYKQGTTEDVDVFANEFEYAFDSGKIGATLDYVQNSGYTKNLTPAQVQNAWEMGRLMSETEAKSEETANIGEYNATRKEGKVKVDPSINLKKLNRKQVSSIYAIRGIAKATGINIEIVNEGIRGREYNGWYDPNTNTIYIDINAGKYDLNLGEYAMLRTLSHELTHYIKANNKSAYKQLQDFVMSKLSDYKGKSLDALIEHEMYDSKGNQIMDRESAAEEVVARACETMLRDSAAIEALYYENQGLFNIIKNFIARFKKAVYKAFDRVGANSEAAKEMLKYADELQALWDNALVGAVHNQQSKGNVAQGEQAVKYEISQIKNYTKSQYIDFGWVAVNDVLTGKEITKLYRQFAKLKLNKEIGYKNKLGEYLIPVGDKYGSIDSIVYIKGTNKHPIIRQIIKINEPYNLNAEKFTMEVMNYESTKLYIDAFEIVSAYARAEVFSVHKAVNYPSYIETRRKARQQNGGGFIVDARERGKGEGNQADSQRKVQSGTSGNVKHERNSLGEELSKEQSEYFKASKVRDKNGNLLVMYHGTPNAGFTVFRRGTYFTAIKGYADMYQNQGASSLGYKKTAENPDTYAVYLNIKKPFDTRDKAARDIFYNEYYRQWGTGTDLMESGLPDWTDGEDLLEFLEEKGYDYDGIVLDEGGTGGYGEEVKSRGISYMVFSPEQVKNIDNLTPTDNPDIRYERAEITEDDVIRQSKMAMAAELTRLRELLKMQGKETAGTVFTKTSVDAVAAKLIKNADSAITKYDLAPMLQKLYGKIASTDNVKFDDVLEEAEAIATEIYNKIRDRSNRIGEYQKEIRDYIRNQPIYISAEAYAEGVAKYGGAKEFHNAWQGKIKFTKDETALPIDALWQEAQGMYGDYFDSEVVTESEMAYKLIDIYDSLKNNNNAEFGEYYAEEIKRQIATDVYDGFWSVSTLNTVADRYGKRIRELKAKHRKTMSEIRQQRDTKIRELKAKNSQRVKGIYESRDKAKVIKTITKRANDLYDKLLTNSPTKHVPERIKQPLAEFLKELDFSSKTFLKTGEVKKKDESFKYKLTKLNNFLQEYTDFANPNNSDGFLDISSVTTTEINNLLEKYKDKPLTINAMSLEDLNVLNKCLREITSAINTANRMFDESIKESTTELAHTTFEDLEEMEKYAGFGDGTTLQKLADFKNWGSTTPYYAFKRFGKVGSLIYKSFVKGQGKYARLIDEVYKFQEKTYSQKEAERWAKNTKTYKLSTGNLKMSDATAMYLYLAFRRLQAVKHIMGSGIRVTGFKSHRIGREIEQDKVKITFEDMAVIEEGLSARQKEVANKLQKFMAQECAAWGNEISMKRYDSNMFTDPNYVPISTVEAGNATDESKATVNDIYRILNLSFTHQVNEKAMNTLAASNLFEVFSKHANDMAKYNAMALPMLDAMKWINFQETVGNDRRAVKTAITDAYGQRALQYITDMMAAVSGARKTKSNPLNTFLRFSKTAAVGANIWTAIKQKTSYSRAVKVLSLSSLEKARVKKIASAQKINKYSGMALWKDMGFYDVNISRNVSSKLLKRATFGDKFTDVSMYLVSKADQRTLRRLWVACEYEIKKKNPTLKPDSEEFNVAVGELLDDVIVATQVVDSTITRSPIMLDTDSTVQQMASFMSEPLLSLNVARDGIEQAKKDIRKGMSRGKAFYKHKGAIMRSFAAFFIPAMLNILLDAISKAYRDDEDKKFADKVLSKLPNAAYENLNPLTYAPIIADITEVFEDLWLRKAMPEDMATAIFGEDFQDDNTMQVYKTIKQIGNTITKWENIANGKSDNYYATVYATSKAVSLLTGLPLGNILREGANLFNNAMDIFEQPELKLRTYEKGKADYIDDFEYYYGNKDLDRCNKIIDNVLEEDVKKYVNQGESKQEAMKKAKSNLRSRFTARYKKLYQEAYLDKDAEECARIIKMLGSTKLYENMSIVARDWREEAKQNQKESQR